MPERSVPLSSIAPQASRVASGDHVKQSTSHVPGSVHGTPRYEPVSTSTITVVQITSFGHCGVLALGSVIAICRPSGDHCGNDAYEAPPGSNRTSEPSVFAV